MDDSSVRPAVGRAPTDGPRPSRAEAKLQTRGRLLDAAYGLLEHQGFDGLSLRHVAREAGVAPAAIYRHFADADELGLALVEESFATLHESIRLARSDTSRGLSAATSSGLVLRFAAGHRDRFRFLSRERRGGSPVLRAAIGQQLDLFGRELAVDLGRDPVVQRWPAEDVALLADLLVGLMADAIDELLDAATPEEEAAVDARVRRRLQLLAVGIARWRPDAPAGG